MKKFDLLTLPGVESKRFVTRLGDEDLVRSLGDLEDTGFDPLAVAVHGCVKTLAQSLNLLTPGIAAVLQVSKNAQSGR